MSSIILGNTIVTPCLPHQSCNCLALRPHIYLGSQTNGIVVGSMLIRRRVGMPQRSSHRPLHYYTLYVYMYVCYMHCLTCPAIFCPTCPLQIVLCTYCPTCPAIFRSTCPITDFGHRAPARVYLLHNYVKSILEISINQLYITELLSLTPVSGYYINRTANFDIK